MQTRKLYLEPIAPASYWEKSEEELKEIAANYYRDKYERKSFVIRDAKKDKLLKILHLNKSSKKVEDLRDMAYQAEEEKLAENIASLDKLSEEELCKLVTESEKARAKKYLKDAMYYQNKAYNILMSQVYALRIQGLYDESFKLLKEASRMPDSKIGEGSYWDESFDFKTMLCTPSNVSHAVSSYFSSSNGKNVFMGKETLANKKFDAPLMLIRKSFEFYYDDDFDIFAKDAELFVRIGSQRIDGCHFKVNFGKNNELRSFMSRALAGIYDIRDSSAMIDNKGRIVLLLCADVPKEVKPLDENVVVGVDLGVTIPAVVSLNNGRERKYIGDGDSFFAQRRRMDEERRALQRNLVLAGGGHGRDKKLRKLNELRDRQSRWQKAVDHRISKAVVDFAVENKAKYINMEKLEGITKENTLLREWSYYRLQQMIEYKAAKYGIEVRYVNPCYTTCVCSICGGYQEGRTSPQQNFVCPNDTCKLHNPHKRINPDWNAAVNIANSTLFVKDTKQKNSLFKEAREYYDIPEEKKENAA